MLLQFIHLAADFFIVFWSVIICVLFILLGIKWVFVDRKFDTDAPSDAADVGARPECIRSDAEAVERKNNVGGEE